MQSRNSGFTFQKKTVANQQDLDSNHWLKKLISRLNIRQKIGLGYGIAIGVAVAGITTGQVIGTHYDQKAQQEYELALEEEHLLQEMQISILQARSHQQQFIPLIKQPKSFIEEHNHFLEHISQVQKIFSDIKTYVTKYAEVDPDIEPVQQWITTHEGATQAYIQRVETLLKQIDPSNLQPDQATVAQRLLLEFTNSEIALKFDGLSDDLSQLVENAHEEEHEAKINAKEAHILRLQIVYFSLLLSIFTAIILAIYISQILARPIQEVTKVAQQVTEEANFTLQAPVTTEDEVGVLATSFNNLIRRVGEYTQEIEESRQNLEQRVERRTAELSQALQQLKQTQSQLIQTEKMSSLGQMVAGVAHEINNPVNFIHGNVDHVIRYSQDLLELIKIYQQRYSDNQIQTQLSEIDFEFLQEDLPKILSSMKMGTDRIRQIVLSLRNFSRLDESEVKAVDVHEGMENTLLILNYRLKQGIEVTKNYGNLPLVECYPAQLNQVFMNIISNAIDVLLEQSNNKEIFLTTEVANEQEVKIKIKDNGAGIPSEIQDKLFDPFFTTKPVGKGTGLGLSICYQIVEKHNGKIEVFSEVGKGTEFAIALPIKSALAT